MVPLRQTYGELVAAATTVRVPYSHLPVSLQSPCVFLSHESYDHCVVAITFVTTTTTACKTLRFLEITFTNRSPHNNTATVWRQYM